MATPILDYALNFVKVFSLIPNSGKEEGPLIYAKIEKICAERGISIARLEREAGLGNATVRGWSKSTPNVETLQKVAKYLEMTLDELTKEEAI